MLPLPAWPGRHVNDLAGKEWVLEKDKKMIVHEGLRAEAPRPRLGPGSSGLEEKGLTGRNGRGVGNRRFGASGIGAWDRYGVCGILWRCWLAGLRESEWR
jgi:hypothetical protein